MASLPTSPPSALARPLDPSFASNRLAVLGAAAGLVLPLLLRRSWRQAVGISGAALLGWATGRELDPDHPETAALALGLAGGASLLGGSGQMQALLPGLSALSSLRLLVGTVGPARWPARCGGPERPGGPGGCHRAAECGSAASGGSVALLEAARRSQFAGNRRLVERRRPGSRIAAPLAGHGGERERSAAWPHPPERCAESGCTGPDCTGPGHRSDRARTSAERP